jgi:hypothetical protein
MTPICQPVSDSLAVAPAKGLSVRTQIVLAACGCAGATAFLYTVDPTQHAVYPQCWLYQATGIYCAGCGATRAVHALLHGRVLAALHDNALMITTLPLLLFVTGSYVLNAWQIKSWPRTDIEASSLMRWGIGSMVVMLAFMVLRNLPGAPFDLLKPLNK